MISLKHMSGYRPEDLQLNKYAMSEYDATQQSIRTPSVISQSPTPTQLSRSGPEGFDALLLRLAGRGDAHADCRAAIMNKRQMEDMEVEQNRRAEDEKYHTSLANRAREDRQRRKERAAEDRKLETVERALEAQEDASFHPLIYIILN
jgi:hypothetical protein